MNDYDVIVSLTTWKNQWCGQSMIPSWVYPMEALSDENVAFRNECCGTNK